MADQKIRVDLVGNSKQLQDSLSKAQRSLKSFGESASRIGRNLSLRITAPLALAGGAAIKFATDTEESLNKVRVAFGDSASEVEEFAKTSLESFGIARGSALDMTALFGDMATGMGVSRKEASKLSTDLVGLAGDLASFKNINIAEVTTALSGVFTGETESLKRLGIVMTETNLKQFALNEGIKTQIKDMTQAEKIALRFQFVLSATANAQGDFARTSGGAANQGRIFQESLKELAASFGEELLPAFTKILKKLNNIIKVFKNLDPSTKKVVVVVGLLAAAIPPLILVVGSLASAFAALNVATGVVGVAIVALTAIVGNVVAYKAHKKEVQDLVEEIPKLKKAVDDAKKSFDGQADSSLNLFKAERKLLKAELDLLKLRKGEKEGFLAEGGALAKSLGTQSKAYEDLGEKIKETQTKIDNYDLSIKALEQSQKDSASSTEDLQKKLSTPIKISDIEFGNEFEDRFQKGLQKAAEDAEIKDAKLGLGIDGSQDGLFDLSSIQDAAQALDEIEEMEAFEDLNAFLDPLAPKLKAFNNQLQATKEIGQMVSETLKGALVNGAEAFGEALISGGNAMAALGSVLLKSLGDILIQMGAAAVAASKLSTTFAVPIVGVAAGLAAIALGGVIKGFASQIQSGGVPALASGGIVSAPTLAMVGDNRGAGRGNPEVIAPLNKLEGMLRGSQSVNVGGELRVQGQDLVVALQRANRNRDRLL